jgi:hypothetical protein
LAWYDEYNQSRVIDFTRDSDCEAALTLTAAIAKAKDEIPSPTDSRRQLPPDPERMNADRALWAGAALQKFQRITGTDHEASLGDLLADLMHWADRNNFDFGAALSRARGHYEAETTGEDA